MRRVDASGLKTFGKAGTTRIPLREYAQEFRAPYDLWRTVGVTMRKRSFVYAILAVVTLASTAQAGCGIEIRFENRMDRQITLDDRLTKVRTVGPGTNPVTVGPWRRLFDDGFRLPANSTRVKQVSLAQGCNAGSRQFEFVFAAGQEIRQVNKIVVIPIDKKFNVRVREFD